MKTLSLCTSVVLFYLITTVQSQTNPTDLNPEFRPNPLGKIIPGRFIIEFDDDYQGSSTDFLSKVESDMNALVRQRIQLRIAQDLTSSPAIFRGVSIALDQDYISPLRKRSDQESNHKVLLNILREHRVKNIYPVVEIDPPRVENLGPADLLKGRPKLDIPKFPALPFTHPMTQVDRVHKELGLTGKGIVIGIIDSGVDYRHPAFGGGFGPGYKVRHGYDLVGDFYNPRYPFTRKTSSTPLDACKDSSGHGTHVSGIIGANDNVYNFTGVAPDATLGVWRIFSCEGSTSNDILIKALLDAHKTKCDIINLSLGSASNWPNDPTSVIVNRIASNGTIVIVSAGNDGAAGAFYISSPSTAPDVVSVASIDNLYNLQAVANTADGKEFRYSLARSTTEIPSGNLLPFTAKLISNEACNNTLPDQPLKGKIALIQRGECTFEEKVRNAKKNGAIGVVLFDNQPNGTFIPEAGKNNLPVAVIDYEIGIQLKKVSKAEGIEIRFKKELKRQDVLSHGKVSKFSSVGPLYDMSFKPDLAAPGGFIFSTFPLRKGGYGMLSGTSMASPFTAGSYALFLQKHGKKGLKYMKEHFQNYAKPTNVTENGLDNPARQGAGLIQLFDTINQSVHISPGSISFNDTEHQTQHTLTITNPTNQTLSYLIRHIPSLSILPYNTTQQGYAPLSPIQYALPHQATAHLHLSHHQLQLNPHQTSQLQVSIRSVDPSPSPYPIYGGYIQFESDLHTLHVPYFGLSGNLSQIPIFDDHYPTLIKPFNLTRAPAEPLVIHRTGRGMRFVVSVFRLLTGSARIVTDVIDQDRSLVGTFVERNYLSRNVLDKHGHYFTQSWNGTVALKGQGYSELKAGTYRLRWRALKLMSDPDLPESWETKLSEPVIIKP